MKIIYNTTFAVELSHADEFVTYLQEVYIPSILETGLLSRHRLVEVLHSDPSEGVKSLALQFEVDALEHLEAYSAEHASQHTQMLSDRFGQAVLGFSTLMREL